MHTSNVLNSSDFVVRQLGSGSAPREMPVAEFFPEYDPEDRIAIVSTDAFDGVRNTAGMFLALTTVFYDALRARSERFYDYPRHFAIVSGDLNADRVGPAWSWLDIWPDSQWIEAPKTASGTLDQLFRHQINRVFWPEPFESDTEGPQLPIHVRRLLESRIKSVCWYRTSAPTHELVLGEGAMKMAQQALDRVAGSEGEIRAEPVERYREAGVSAFLECYGNCFASK